MKQKILSAAREIGYVPNEAAKLLKSGKNTVENVRRIYILLPRITSAEGDPFYTEMLRLTELEIRKNSCMVAGIWNNEQFSDEEWCKKADVAGKVGELFNNASVNCDGLIMKTQVKDSIRRSPFFYVGDKYKLVPQLKEHFPNDIENFIEPFCGGGSVFLNVDAERYTINDIDAFPIFKFVIQK